jgi:kynurenine 3-monooxygenase
MQGRMVHAVDGSQNLQPYGKEGQAIYSVSRGELNKVLMNEAESNQNVTITFERFCHHVDLPARKIFFSRFTHGQ